VSLRTLFSLLESLRKARSFPHGKARTVPRGARSAEAPNSAGFPGFSCRVGVETGFPAISSRNALVRGAGSCQIDKKPKDFVTSCRAPRRPRRPSRPGERPENGSGTKPRKTKKGGLGLPFSFGSRIRDSGQSLRFGRGVPFTSVTIFTRSTLPSVISRSATAPPQVEGLSAQAGSLAEPGPVHSGSEV